MRVQLHKTATGAGFTIGNHMFLVSSLWSRFTVETHKHVEWTFWGPFRYLRFYL